MKTLKTLTAAILIILSTSAFAAKKNNNEKLLVDYTIKKFVNAVSYGDTKGVSNIFDKDVKMTTAYKQEVVNYNKEEILTTIKFVQNVKQNCQTEYQMIERTPTQALAKVSMKYESFTKVNYISLANTTEGWKITHISTSLN
jgi:hypothetical protein